MARRLQIPYVMEESIVPKCTRALNQQHRLTSKVRKGDTAIRQAAS